MKEIQIYTDGACLGNPGPGGYGAVLLYGDHRKELSGGYRHTTNNRMELMAAIVALTALKESCTVRLFSDSRYLVDAMTEDWVSRWKRNGWKKSNRDGVLNVDLWEQLFELCSQHQVKFVWVPGHSGVAENERCDQLSYQAAQDQDLPADPGYA